MKVSLGAKLVIYTTSIIIMVALLYGFFLIEHERTLLTDQLMKRGAAIAAGIANNCQYGVLTEDKVILQSFVKGAMAQRDVEYAVITNSEGVVLASSQPEKALLADGLVKKIIVPVKMEESAQGMGYVTVGISIKNLNIQMAQMKMIVVGVTAAIAFFVILISMYFSQRITRPIRELVGITQNIARGDLTQRISDAPQDEIGDLAESFNSMTEDLKVSRDALEEHSKTLEEKVRERTKELEQAYHELRQTQAQLIQSAKMTAIGQLGAGVAHELNNPIGGIMGYAHFMLDKIREKGLSPDDIEIYKKHLEYIEKESKRCSEIVENLLSFSRKSVELKPVDITKVIKDTLSIMQHQLGLQNIKVRQELPDGLGKVEGHANQLQQVFTNLILNAQQAMKDGGELAVSARNIMDEKTNKPKEVEIKFKDTGVGIAKENLHRIFEPFFTTKLEWKGTGLGLSVSYQIIESHKGNIKAESQGEAKGSTFIVTLPVSKKRG